MPHEKLKELTRNLLFIPSSANSKCSSFQKIFFSKIKLLKLSLNQVPLKRKLGEEKDTPRILENEGYYVGRKPFMTRSNKNLMSDRILIFNKNVCESLFLLLVDFLF